MDYDFCLVSSTAMDLEELGQIAELSVFYMNTPVKPDNVQVEEVCHSYWNFYLQPVVSRGKEQTPSKMFLLRQIASTPWQKGTACRHQLLAVPEIMVTS